jgi:hypothetical protein
MRILLKCPTRSRPRQVIETLQKYIRLANSPKLMGIAVSCDLDDVSMTKNLVREEIETLMRKTEWGRIYYSDNHSKIEACNANMNEIDYPWDIVVLVSDDMIPRVGGYDDIIRSEMTTRFPDRNGILWFNDGHQADKLNTLCVYGRAFYERQGYIYHPAYKSLFCDTELTDLCRTEYKDVCAYISNCIIRHEHPGTGFADKMDALYQINQKYWNDDMYTYISRKQYAYDWSILIPSIVERDSSLKSLLESLREKIGRIAPDLKVEYCIEVDNREMSIGNKRQKLLENANGKYLSFIDDDDDITDAYVEDVLQMIRGNWPVMRLRGKIAQYTFTHSLENRLTDKMARGDVFLRPPNHLNPMLSDVAKLVRFKDATRGEDLEWTIRMARTGFLAREYQSDSFRIHYIYNMGERAVDPRSLEYQKQTSYETMLQMVWTPSGARVPDNPPAQPLPQRQPGLRLGPRGFVSTQ